MPSGLVVGGGLAGSAAAVRLAEAGWKVTLLERLPGLGGKVSSFLRRGERLDNAQHVATKACTAFRGFLDRIGSGGLMRWQARLRIPFASPGGGLSVLERADLPAPFHLLPGLLSFDLLGLSERLALARVLKEARTAAPGEGDFRAWLEARGQSVSAIARFWDPLVLAVLNASPAETGAEAALWVVREGLLGAPDAMDLGIATVPQSELFAPAVEAFLRARGGEVRTRSGIEALEAGEVRLESGERLKADGIVLAVPWEEAERLLSLPPSGLRPGSVLSVSMLLDRPVLPEGEAFVALADSAVQWAFAKPPGGRRLSLVVSGARRHLHRSGADLVAMSLASLRACLPRMEGARVLDAVVMKERRATFLPSPGSASLRRCPGDSGTAGVALAGAWTATSWPATMEGAVLSGNAAAGLLLH